MFSFTKVQLLLSFRNGRLFARLLLLLGTRLALLSLFILLLLAFQFFSSFLALISPASSGHQVSFLFGSLPGYRLGAALRLLLFARLLSFTEGFS
jgi:hypothetical protein